MSELLKSFDMYDDFQKNYYFTLNFDVLPSAMKSTIPFEESKESIEAILSLLDLKANNYSLIFKDWNTEDSKNADFSLDFPYRLLYKSNKEKSIIYIALEDETLNIDFYYDCNDTVLEQKMIEMNHKLRTNYGLLRKPTFKVLSKNHGMFHTEDVRTEDVHIDIEKNYNADFKNEQEKIQQAVTSNTSGLILLYGKPGTGKTTFIKSLITKNKKANFIFVQNEFVNNLLDPDFISFLLKQRNSTLVIEDAEKVITSREKQNEESVVSTILQLTDGLFSDYLNIKIICTFNTSLSKIDNALLRKGRMISKYEFQELSLEKTNKLLKELGFKTVEKGLSIAEIYNQDKEGYSNNERNKIGF